MAANRRTITASYVQWGKPLRTDVDIRQRSFYRPKLTMWLARVFLGSRNLVQEGSQSLGNGGCGVATRIDLEIAPPVSVPRFFGERQTVVVRILARAIDITPHSPDDAVICCGFCSDSDIIINSLIWIARGHF